MYTLYSLVAGLALALGAPWWLLKMLRHGKYRAGLGERLGRVPARVGPPGFGAIWVHAVSVGEVLAAGGMIVELRSRFPERRVLISTTTAAGQALARQRFGGENVFYFPLDFGFSVRPWLRALRPELVVLAETEFWPNFLRLARLSGARVAVINARISDRSFPRYRLLRRLIQRVLQHVDAFLAQSEEDRRRLIAIGAAPERVRVSGNLKFEVRAPAGSRLVDNLRRQIAESRVRPVLVFGSTVEGEEALLIPTFRAVLERFPKTLVVVAPRHPERFAAVAELLAASGVRFWKRSEWNGSQSLSGGILLLDSIGELASVYALAEVAFVGGSLVSRGGHNIVEPAQHGAAIVIGPHTENFRDVVAIFRQADAVRVVEPAALSALVVELLTNDTARRELGQRARYVVSAQSGATARTVAALDELLRDRGPATKLPASLPIEVK